MCLLINDNKTAGLRSLRRDLHNKTRADKSGRDKNKARQSTYKDFQLKLRPARSLFVSPVIATCKTYRRD